MDREKQIAAAQLAILTRYNLLADCSELEDAVLKRIVKGLPKAEGDGDQTFANWCREVIGEGIRLPIARFDYAVAGQTRISSLTNGSELAQRILNREKEQQASIRGYRRDIKRLEAELVAKSLPEKKPLVVEPKALDGFSADLRRWYQGNIPNLCNLVRDIKEVEGEFLNHQGSSNRDYRAQLINIILPTLESLDRLGISIKVELRDQSQQKPAIEDIVIYESQALTLDKHYHERFSFVVSNVQADILDIAERFPGEIQSDRFASEPTPKLSCFVSLFVETVHPMNDDEFFHLSCFLQKLFSALAKSSDRSARGILRERVLLCLMLSWTAPCMPARERLTNKLGSEIINQNWNVADAAKLHETSDLPAGKIVDHWVYVMRESLGA